MRHFQGVRTVLRRGLSSVGGAGVGSLSAVVTEPRSPKIDELGRAYGTGRRKTSVARVWIRPGDGKVRINGKSLAEAFPRDVHQDRILDPLFYTTSLDKFDVWGTVQGGGISGQAGAFCHGLARALDSYAPLLRPILRKEGLMTRDPRMVEPKKPGRPKARKKKQWVKR